MPTLRGDGIRDIFVKKGQARNLRDFFGDRSLDPGHPEDMAQIKAIAEGYIAGAYNDEQIEKFVRENPATQPFLNLARAKVEAGRKYFDPGSPAVTPFEGEFAGKAVRFANDEVGR